MDLLSAILFFLKMYNISGGVLLKLEIDIHLTVKPAGSYVYFVD